MCQTSSVYEEVHVIYKGRDLCINNMKSWTENDDNLSSFPGQTIEKSDVCVLVPNIMATFFKAILLAYDALKINWSYIYMIGYKSKNTQPNFLPISEYEISEYFWISRSTKN